MLFETYGGNAANAATGRFSQQSTNLRNASRRTGVRPSVFNNFGKSLPVRGSFYAVQARGAGNQSNRINRTISSNQGTSPDKLPQKGGPNIDNPGKTPGTDWGVPGDCPCGNPGCQTLNRFAKASFATTAAHEPLLLQLADDIIRQNINVVVITGHTDTEGTDENNLILGARRSFAVEKKLKNILHKRKPWSELSVYFRTDSKGESQTVSGTDDGLNRRVEVCLRRMPMPDKTILNL